MFDVDVIRQARQTDIAAYLSRKGEEIKREGNGFCLAEHDSLKIRDNMYALCPFGAKRYWFSQGKSGNAIDFVMIYYGLSFKDAVEELTGKGGAITIPKKRYTDQPKSYDTPQQTELPPRADNEKRVIAYLNQKRGLHYNTIVDLIKRGLIYQDVRGNCVFVIRDFTTGAEIGYELRGTGEQKFCRISAHRGFGFNLFCTSVLDITDSVESVLLFESAVDLLSYRQFYHPYQNELLVSMGGVNPSVAENCAALFPDAELVVCTDNDEAGENFAANIAEHYPDRTRRKIPPEGKDWNDFLRDRFSSFE